jgi:protein-disulfide isomerase
MLNRSHLDTLLTGVMAACAIAVVATLVRREWMPAPDPQAPVAVDEWKAYGVGNKRVGPARAAVTIVEFSDFQCPWCGKFFRALKAVRGRHRNEVALVYRNLPIQTLHPHARAAAIAAECAAAQGQFERYHALLFEQQDSLGVLPWAQFAVRAGVRDTSAFEQCRRSDAALDALKADSIAAAALQVTGTPTILVNQWRLRGTPSETELEELVTKQLRKAR